jgi:uncharacterized membrane protein HdeD (DUF308 family)
VLKFNHASVTTVGILIGVMLLVFAAEDFLLASLDRGGRWLWAIFGVLLTVGGIVALIHPERTFTGFADILGFVFLLIGVLWMVQAFAKRPINGLWWMTPRSRSPWTTIPAAQPLTGSRGSRSPRSTALSSHRMATVESRSIAS